MVLLVSLSLALACGDDAAPDVDGGETRDGGAERDAALDGSSPDDASFPDAGAEADGGAVVDPLDLSWSRNETSEGGAAVELRITLTTEPNSVVDIILGTTDENLLEPDQRRIRFLPANWSTPQTVNLIPRDDTLARGDQRVRVWFELSSGDTFFGREFLSEALEVRDDETSLIAEYVEVRNSAACAVRAGRVWCWGNGRDGMIGNGSTADSRYPFDTGVTSVATVAMGDGHGVALHRDGTVTSWGTGRSTGMADFTAIHPPTPIPDLDEVAELDSGNDFACGRTTAGRVLCWGFNSRGQLGDGTMSSRVAAAPVLTGDGELTGATKIALGGAAACALLEGGDVTCWGRNLYGELGASGDDQPLANTLVPGLANVVDIVGGSRHFCARRDDGAVLCWGDPPSLPVEPMAPSTLAELPDVRDAELMAAGSAHTCVQRSSGELVCFGVAGSAIFGQDEWRARLADNPPTANRFPGDFTQLSGGGQQLCGLERDTGRVECMGSPVNDILAADGWDDAEDVTLSPVYTTSSTNYRVAPPPLPAHPPGGRRHERVRGALRVSHR